MVQFDFRQNARRSEIYLKEGQLVELGEGIILHSNYISHQAASMDSGPDKTSHLTGQYGSLPDFGTSKLN